MIDIDKKIKEMTPLFRLQLTAGDRKTYVSKRFQRFIYGHSSPEDIPRWALWASIMFTKY